MTDIAEVPPATSENDDERMPQGWAAGMWRLTGHSEVPGWLLLPAEVDDRDAWVQAQLAEIRTAWAEHWRDEWAEPVAALLGAALDARPDEAALAFELWPVPAPLVAQVSASFGARPAALPDAVREGDLYPTEQLGDGVLLVRELPDPVTGITLIGTDILFASAEAVVLVRLEPTLPELHAMLIGQFHAFVHTLEFLGPDGTPVRGVAPEGMLAARSDADWADSVPTR
ncbi:hypothetical protein BKA24_000949 [Microbacterium marinum]|uniref:Uncharacterized protein n=1 Tax=Microbacterium marinum TaxID=421115 RepID=A0A7W7BP57_9MICO|nr:hypothetical protein [Microbacterium marinum]MBB4666240.1 hypothetical protein [Microbacterium marinum]